MKRRTYFHAVVATLILVLLLIIYAIAKLALRGMM